MRTLPGGDTLQERFLALDALIADHVWLWREQPFKTPRPRWTSRAPSLATRAYLLDAQQADEMVSSNDALIDWVAQDVPAIQALRGLLDLGAPSASPTSASPHLSWDVPGRKWDQISWFAAQIGPLAAPVVEWCSGKGHLGRLVAKTYGVSVTSLDVDAQLLEAGGKLSARAGVDQQFVEKDVLAAPPPELAGCHVIALHACGELHRSLLKRARALGVVALDVAPCCYHLQADTPYRGISGMGSLSLTRDDLRLAVTETATAKGRERRMRDRAHAWRLGYVALRSELLGDACYRPIKPIVTGWLAEGFAQFCKQLASRDDLLLPEKLDWARFETVGWARHAEVTRLSVPRLAFRRAIEVWLALDLALNLSAQGFDAGVAPFCPRELTPRNLRVFARS